MSKIEQALAKRQAESAARGEQAAPGGEPRKQPLRADTGGRDIARMRPHPRWTPRELEARGFVDFTGRDRNAINAFRHLRTALLQRVGAGNFILGVTGAVSDAGATFVARNLAAAVAFDPNKTALLVDANLQEPAVSRLADPERSIGLTDFLLDETEAVDALIQPTGVPRLRVMPVGRSARTTGEIFTGERIRNLFDHLRARYPDRMIVVDMPSVTSSADAQILAQACDFVLLVLPYGRTSARQVEQAMEVLPSDRLIGTVFNNDPLGWS